MTVNATKEDILFAFQQLSPKDQLEVAEMIENVIVEEETKHHPLKHTSSREAAGMLLRPGQTPPTDEEVEQWIHEAMSAKI